MNTNTLPGPTFTLGDFLRDRRARLQPEPGAGRRRRTPGLRREEVAARASVSVTWYTWLEQGRGGPASNEVLERLARGLELDAPDREILFLLAQRRPPPLNVAPPATIAADLQRVIDAMPMSPVIVKTPTWDIVGWNAAATAVLGDYGALPVRERNTLRRLFRPEARDHLPDWEDNARFAIAVFRVDAARAGDRPEAAALAADLLETSADFRRLWAETEMRSHGTRVKRFDHPQLGPLALETTAFAVDGAEGLSMIVFTPVSPADAAVVAAMIADPSLRS